MSLAEFVRARRKALHLTQEELAERAEPMNQTTISLIERGRLLQPSHGYMLRLAHGLGVPVTDLYLAGGFVEAPALAPETIAPTPHNDEDGLAEALAQIDAMTDDEVIRFAEGLPGEYHRRFMAEEKRLRSHPSYVRFCRGMLGAFASNRNAALKAARSARE